MSLLALLTPLSWLTLLSCRKEDPDPPVVSIPTEVEPTTPPTTPPACDAPVPALPRGGDASDDAAATGAWFRSVRVDGITVDRTTSGAAWVDLDRDGHLDAVLTRDDEVEILHGEGCFQFEPLPFEVDGGLGEGLGAPMAVDLDHDGWLDLYLPSEGVLARSRLLLSDGRPDRFREVASAMGVDNPGAYVRGGASLGDLDSDGWFDFAIGGHQIGHGGVLGRPLSRLYMYRPTGATYSEGTYEDLGGTAAAPGFGGIPFAPCTPGSEATGHDATLHDLDGDGVLDLLWATHNDMYGTTSQEACTTGSNLYGLRLWRGTSPTEVALVEADEGPGVPVDKGRMRFDEAKGYYVVDTDGPALGPEILSLFDPDRDGDLDLLAVGPTDPDWGVTSDQTTALSPGRGTAFFRNDLGSFSDTTDEVGLRAMDWTLGQWSTFFEAELPLGSPVMDNVCAAGAQEPLCTGLPVSSRLPYPGQALPFDADNDGAVDLLYVVRQCVYDVADSDDDIRSVLFHNRGDGTYEPLVTEISGITGCGLAAFAEDLDSDGWLDVHLLLRDELQTHSSYADLVFRNVGALLSQGTNHWVTVALVGLPEEELLSARVLALDDEGQIVSSGWAEREAWRGSRIPTIHLGLGQHEHIRLEVRLRDGTERSFEDQPLDQALSRSLGGQDALTDRS